LSKAMTVLSWICRVVENGCAVNITCDYNLRKYKIIIGLDDLTIAKGEDSDIRIAIQNAYRSYIDILAKETKDG